MYDDEDEDFTQDDDPFGWGDFFLGVGGVALVLVIAGGLVFVASLPGTL